MQARDSEAPGPANGSRRARPIDTSLVILVGIAVAAACAVAWTKGPARVGQIALDYTLFLGVLTPKIVFGFFVAASVPILIPPAVMARWVGKDSGMRGLLVASIAGGLVPGGPMMIFPLAAGFRAAGAPVAVLISFVTAWSLYGINRTVIWEMSFLPTGFVVMRVLICLPLPFLVGWVAARVLR